jgi:hypothetical protein
MSCPAQDRWLSKDIKYSYTLFGVGEAPGDALSTILSAPATFNYVIVGFGTIVISRSFGLL